MTPTSSSLPRTLGAARSVGNEQVAHRSKCERTIPAHITRTRTLFTGGCQPMSRPSPPSLLSALWRPGRWWFP